ncbi:cyclic nucleotide-binding domain-containing protein [soil metagenome]
MKTLKDILPLHPFWKNLAPAYRDLLLGCAAIEHYHAGEPIFRKGNDADHFYLIHTGKVALETPYTPGNGMITIQTLGGGEVLGWSWLFPPYRWHFGAKAVDATEAIVFKAEAVRVAARENPAFGYDLAIQVGGILLERLQSTRMRLLETCEVAA